MSRKITPEEYVQWLKDDGRGIVASACYVDAKTKILHRCQMGHEWLAQPLKIKSGRGCPHCSGHAQRYDPDAYRLWLSENRPELTLLENYKGSQIPCKHRCAEGHEWMALPAGVKQGSGCPHCSGRIPETSYPEWLEDHRSGLVLLEPYVNALTKIRHRCGQGHEWQITPADVKSGKGCPHCSGRVPENYHQWLAREGDGITAEGEYRTNTHKLLHRCREGHEWMAQPMNIKQGRGCPECAEHGFNPSKPAILYVAEHRLKRGRIRVNIGITNRTFEERYTGDDLKTVLRREVISGGGHEMARVEAQTHSALAPYLDKRGLGLRLKKGTKECFDIPYETALEHVRRLAKEG